MNISLPIRGSSRPHRYRLYLSGPITGYANHNRSAFADAQEALEASGYAVINPLLLSDETDWHACMRKDIQALMACEGVATLDGWERSRGAKLEVSLATKLDMPVQHWSQWAKEGRTRAGR